MKIKRISCVPQNQNKKPLRYFVGAAMGVLVVATAFVIGAPSIRLVAASLDPNGEVMAIIENSATGKQEVFDLNNNVFGQGKLIDVENGKATIEQDGQSYSFTTRGGGVTGNDLRKQQVAEELRNTQMVQDIIFGEMSPSESKDDPEEAPRAEKMLEIMKNIIAS